MKKKQQSSNGNTSEYNEQLVQQTEVAASRSEISEEQRQLDRLMDAGFMWEEAVRLLDLHEHLYQNSEIRQRVADDSHMLFMRWLHERGEINEENS